MYEILPLKKARKMNQPDKRPNPTLVDIFRGGHLESQHRGTIAVVDGQGKIVSACGDIDKVMFPRSAYKIIQAIPLMETGAADAFDLSSERTALCCASHSGAHIHVEAVGQWLGDLGQGEADLICGPQVPMGLSEGPNLLRTGKNPTRMHNNCSGKHSGFLTLNKHLKTDAQTYTSIDHPVQKMIRTAIGEVCCVKPQDMPYGIDGCSAPNFALPLYNLAWGAARIASGDGLDSDRARAGQRLIEACAFHPELIAGEDRMCTRLMRLCKTPAYIKVGAEGVYIAALPTLGLGVALKIDDGTTRGAEVAIAKVLMQLGVIDEDAAQDLIHPTIENWDGLNVGAMAPVKDWPLELA
jgi:L-asparaginase II